MNTQKSKAYRLAAELDPLGGVESEAAAELRRLHEVNAELIEALKGFLIGTSVRYWPADIYTKAESVFIKATGEQP